MAKGRLARRPSCPSVSWNSLLMPSSSSASTPRSITFTMYVSRSTTNTYARTPLLNIKAFLLVARTGSFSGAARELGVAPSVVTKRITRLEDEMGAQLFVRSTRALALTPAGERLLPQYQRLVAELDEIIGAAAATERGIEGHLRIKGPTTLTSMFLGAIFSEFH